QRESVPDDEQEGGEAEPLAEQGLQVRRRRGRRRREGKRTSIGPAAGVGGGLVVARGIEGTWVHNGKGWGRSLCCRLLFSKLGLCDARDLLGDALPARVPSRIAADPAVRPSDVLPFSPLSLRRNVAIELHLHVRICNRLERQGPRLDGLKKLL